ncbi:hypothetical protein [Nostoc sp.]|uniref:hypothetical protein n=1 Tax=Nostoc sp. TaxID=1180 RepID=UPI003FA60292
MVNGPTGVNILNGGDGNDYLWVSGFSNSNYYGNTLNGGNGNDTLTSANGNDILVGGNGNDTFAFNSYNDGVNSINDFNATNDLIQVSAFGFDGMLSTPSLQKSQFTIGTSATTTAQRFII